MSGDQYTEAARNYRERERIAATRHAGALLGALRNMLSSCLPNEYPAWRRLVADIEREARDVHS